MISISRICKGDKKEFKKLFDDFFIPLCVFALKYINSKEDVKDIVQGVFISFWENTPKLHDDKNIRSYLYSVVRNRCLNFIRDNKDTSQDLDILKDEFFFDKSLIETETYHILEQAIKTLPRRTEEVIRLSMKGLKNKDIAEIMNVSENTIHSLKSIAYKRLKKLLTSYYYLILLFLTY